MGGIIPNKEAGITPGLLFTTSLPTGTSYNLNDPTNFGGLTERLNWRNQPNVIEFLKQEVKSMPSWLNAANEIFDGLRRGIPGGENVPLPLALLEVLAVQITGLPPGTWSDVNAIVGALWSFPGIQDIISMLTQIPGLITDPAATLTTWATNLQGFLTGVDLNDPGLDMAHAILVWVTTNVLPLISVGIGSVEGLATALAALAPIDTVANAFGLSGTGISSAAMGTAISRVFAGINLAVTNPLLAAIEAPLQNFTDEVLGGTGNPTSALVSYLQNMVTMFVSEAPSGILNGVNSVFNLGNVPTSGSIQVFVNGLLQHADSFTLSGTNLTLTTPPGATDVLHVLYQVGGSGAGSGFITSLTQAITGVSSGGMGTLQNWFTDFKSLLGPVTGLGTGSPVLPGISNIPLLGGLVSTGTGLLKTSVFPVITSAMTSGLADIDTLVQSWGGTGTGHTIFDLGVYASSLPNTAVQGLLGSTAIGGTVQSFVDTTVQAIQGNAITGNTFGILGTVLGAFAGLVGYTSGGQPAPVASIANITSIDNLHITARAVNTNVFDGIDKTADAVFPFATWDGTLINVVEGTEAWGVVATPHGGLKEAVEFYGGYNTSSGTLGGLYISIYAFNANNVSGTQQTVTVVGIGNAPTSFTLTFKGATTVAIPFGASARTVETALSTLSTVGGPANVSVCGGPFWYVVNFIGALASTTQPTITGTTTGGSGSFISAAATAYGSKTWLWTSNNLVTDPGVGNAMAWNYANIPNSNGYFNSAQGEYFAMGISIRGTATYTVAGQVHPAIQHPSAVPGFFGGTQPVWPGSQWGSVGAGRTGIQTRSGSESQTLVGTENCLVVFANVYGGNTAITGVSCTVAGTTVPLVWNSGNISPNGDFNYLCAFVLIGTAGTAPFTSGAKAVVVTATGGQTGVCGMAFQSIAKGGVISVGTPQSMSGTGTQASQTYSDANHGQMDWVNAFASLNGDFTDYSGAQAARFPGTTPSYPMVCGAGHGINGSNNGRLVATIASSSPWYGLMIPVNSLWSPMQANQIASPNYSGNMPWFGLCGNPGVSQIINTYQPQLLYFNSGTTPFNPADYPWANWFDIMLWGSASGGSAGSSTHGGVAGQHGSTAVITLARSQISGATWTLNIASASAGGLTGAGPGAAGVSSTAVVPGWGTLTAPGGAQTSGANGSSIYGQLGAAAPDINWHDAYGDYNTYPGGAGGANANAAGGQPGGAGAGGNALGVGTLTAGGNGGAGFGYILVYQ